jgi:hypothetical protein
MVCVVGLQSRLLYRHVDVAKAHKLEDTISQLSQFSTEA